MNRSTIRFEASKDGIIDLIPGQFFDRNAIINAVKQISEEEESSKKSKQSKEFNSFYKKK